MIEIKNVSKTFLTQDNTVEALKNVNISINDGEIFGIIGMSGAGKSTLVRCINMLERPTSGTVIVDGVNLAELKPKELRAQRSKITMIFQGFNLLQQRNCLKNVCFPLELAGVKKADAEKKALELLEIVGLKEKAESFPSQLSGGQQQRVAIARSLATNPKVLLCDEATSALDPKTTESILELIRDINKRLGITVIVITHQMSVVEKICNKVAILDDGEVVETGDVSEVFIHPKSKVARHLVFPESDNGFDCATDKKVLRAVFAGKTASDKALIAELASSEQIMANIRYASTKSILNKAYGNMLLEVENDEEIITRTKKFFEDRGVVIEEFV